MAEKEYIVSLNRDVDAADFAAEMTQSTGSSTIPNRSVDVANSRLGSYRNTHYSLSEEEVAALKGDPRVLDVEEPPSNREDISIGIRGRQVGVFKKTDLSDIAAVNWGLRRCIDKDNPYGTSTEVTGDYTYNLDGTGVDVVIQDSGIQADHPEWQDADGNSRLQQIDWYQESGVSGDTQHANHYRDYDGHGTHVAGIAAGKTFGWAKNARIYAMKISGLEGSGDVGGIPDTYAFDAIKLWHRQKPVTSTGYKRPTVVNMSWGYGTYFYNVASGVYRGASWSSPDTSGIYRDTSKGMIGRNVHGFFGYRFGIRVSSMDVDMQELIDEGVHCVVAAGNYYQKIDVPSGNDYDNRFTNTSATTYYYNRGSSPFDDQAFIVGNIDSDVVDATTEQKAETSECGPGVDIYAPGTNIISACSNTNDKSAVEYHLDDNFKQVNISGTSMAAPQVAGHIAHILQMRPDLTPDQMKSKVLNQTGIDKIYSTGLDNDYTNSRSISNGNNKFLFTPYSNEYRMSIGRS